MSYERAMEAWRRQTIEPPSFSQVQRAVRLGTDPSLAGARATRWARLMLAVAATGFIAMILIEVLNVEPYPGAGRALAAMLPLFLLGIAGWMIPQRQLGRQMLVRAIAWSNLVIGVIVSVWGFEEFALTGVPIVLGSGACLLVLGGKGLGIQVGPFRPIAFRNQLLVALVMACADAETLLFSGIVQLGFGRQGWEHAAALWVAGPTLVCGAVMALAVWGLYRMRTWALFLNILANLGIAYLALSGFLGLTLPVGGALATTALVQLLLPVPILAVAMGDRTPDRSPLGRAGPVAVRLAVVALMLGGALGWKIPSQWRDGAGLTYWRTGWVDRIYVSRSRGVKWGSR